MKIEEINPALALGGIGMIIGSFLPWASLGFISVSGMQGDGVFTLIAGVLALVLAFAKPRTAVVVWSLIIGAVGLIEFVMVTNGFSELAVETGETILGSPTLGGGIYLIGIGGVAVIVGAFKASSAKSKALAQSSDFDPAKFTPIIDKNAS